MSEHRQGESAVQIVTLCTECREPWPCTDALREAVEARDAQIAVMSRYIAKQDAEGDAWDAERDALTQRVAELSKMLHDLTPGGSEYVDNPTRCYDWVQDRMSDLIRDAVRLAKERNGMRHERDLARAQVAERDQIISELQADPDDEEMRRIVQLEGERDAAIVEAQRLREALKVERDLYHDDRPCPASVRLDAVLATTPPTASERRAAEVPCSHCGKRVSGWDGDQFIVRAWVECPECVQTNNPEDFGAPGNHD